jgi:structure-specific endonuclease subunit SLX1
MSKMTTLPGLPSSLAELHIVGGLELTSISEGLQHLTALKDLYLAGCVKLNSLPENIQHLTSLSRLRIHGCSNLMSLPEGIRNLEMLREFEIADCPNLERRCKREKGKDWPKIAHIPTIIINAQLIQSSET